MSKYFLALFTLFLTYSCSFAPSYQRPELEMPAQWRVESDETSTFANMRWWEQLGDPVLNRLIVEALENNRDLKIAIERVYEYYALWGIASSGFFPQIFGNFLGNRTQYSLETALAPPPELRTFNDFYGFLDFAWELDIWGRIWNTSRAGQFEYLGQVEARRTVVLTLVASVANSYVNLRMFDKQLLISRQTVVSRQKSYELAVMRFEGGISSELEVRQAESEVEAAIAEIKRLEILVEQQENFISVLLGHYPDYIERGLGLDELYLPPCVPAGIPSEILVQRPDILRAEADILAANARIGVARAQFFPRISLTGFYGAESESLKNFFKSTAETWQYGGSLLQPIFTGFRLINELNVAESRKCQAYYGYQSVVLNALKEVDDALIAHQKTKELLEVQARRVAALRSYLRLATLQYNNGQVDYLNVLDAERSLFVVLLSYTETQSDIFTTYIDLYRALGGGWVIDADSIALSPCE